MSFVPPFEDDLFWEKVEITDGCWLWTASSNGNGYGTYSKWKLNRYAHRYAYEMVNGAIPDGLEIDHLCCTRSCVRPDHLEAVTHAENARRAHSKTTHCPRGHEYTEENTRIMTHGNGRRACKQCGKHLSKKRARAKGVRKQGTYGIHISSDTISQIKLLLSEGQLSQKEIAKRAGCSQTYVSQVKLGKVKWVDAQ